jgi:uncharacterized protein (TIGR04222 family)
MTHIAGDTWGIAGPTFLLIYVALGLAVVAGVIIWRRRYTSGPTGPERSLTPTEVALLTSGRELAVYSSLASLRAAGAVQIEGGHLQQTGPVPLGAPELDRTIHAAAGRRSLRSRDVAAEPSVAAVLERAEAELTESGLLLSPAVRSHVRRGALAGVALLAFGIVRAIAGTQNGKPIGNLILLLVLAGAGTIALSYVPRLSRAARSSLATLRRDASHLRPSQSPSWATYGPASAALGVGLFGTAAIWAADPAFAADAEIRRQTFASSGGVDGGSGSGSSCGGGGCGGGGGGGGGGCGG